MAQRTEANVSIIVACVPTLGPAVQLIHEKFRSSKMSHHSIKHVRGWYRVKQSSTPIPLRALPDLQEETRYEDAAIAAPHTYIEQQGSYESL